ncbi:MAG: hypothetical protein PHE25_00035 [Candidatus Gracilibacteria bacterium]|nr:hypothetical protein [Candidatus Gracilibacteria bacterium]
MKKLLIIISLLFFQLSFADNGATNTATLGGNSGGNPNPTNSVITSGVSNATNTATLGNGTSNTANTATLGGTSSNTSNASSSSTTSGGSSDNITVKVTEKIPGAECGECSKKGNDGGCLEYTCKVQPGFTSITLMIGQIIKWFTAIAALAGVGFIVLNGMFLSIGGEGKDEIKKKIVKTIAGIILLLLSGLILNIIAPWVYK